MNFSSKLIENTVNAFATLPGIGKKTALRLTLHLLNEPTEATNEFCQALSTMREQISFCRHCHNVADNSECQICLSPTRDSRLICVVESIRDVLAIENTQQYSGQYHVLGGLISPINGISPSHLHIESLVQRVGVPDSRVREVIFALSPTIDGDTTAFYITKLLQATSIKLSTLARGIAFGGELEYADEVTLGRSIISRLPYSGTSTE